MYCEESRSVYLGLGFRVSAFIFYGFWLYGSVSVLTVLTCSLLCKTRIKVARQRSVLGRALGSECSAWHCPQIFMRYRWSEPSVVGPISRDIQALRLTTVALGSLASKGWPRICRTICAPPRRCVISQGAKQGFVWTFRCQGGLTWLARLFSRRTDVNAQQGGWRTCRTTALITSSSEIPVH